MRYLCLAFAALTLVACNDKPPAKTFIDPQLQALEKARGVEEKLREAEQKREQETESAAPPY